MSDRLRTRISSRLPPGSFLRSVSILTGGTVFAQGLTVVALPVLTRLYSPEDFNLLAVYVAILGIITTISCLRYNIAIPLPADQVDGMTLLAVSLLAALVVSLLCALPVILAPGAMADLLGQPSLQDYLWMIPVGVLIASIYNALQYWSTRKKNFSLIARTRITRAVGGVGMQLGLGAAAPSPFGLIVGHMIYGGLGILGLARNLVREDGPILRQITAARTLAQAWEQRRFPFFSVPEALFNAAATQLPILVIAAVATGPEAAFLFLAMRVLGLPMSLAGRSVAQVFLAEAPAKLHDGTLAAFTREIMWALFKVGAPPMAAVGLISPIAFPLLFGEDWVRAGWLVTWMTPWFVLQFVASPVSMVLHVMGRQGVALTLQATGLFLRLGSVIILVNGGQDFVSEMYAISGFAFYLLYSLVVLAILPKMQRPGSGDRNDP